MKLEAEMEEMGERNRKWEDEQEDRKAEMKLKEIEFGLKKDEARVKFSVMQCGHLLYV